MNSVNNCTLVGNLGKDPEIRFIDENRSVAKLSIATQVSWYSKKEESWMERTTWHTVVVWNPGKKLQEAKKGDRVCVIGAYESRSWDDKDGNKRYSMELNASAHWVIPSGSNSFKTEEQKQEEHQKREEATQKSTMDPPGRDFPSGYQDDTPFPGADDLPF